MIGQNPETLSTAPPEPRLRACGCFHKVFHFVKRELNLESSFTDEIIAEKRPMSTIQKEKKQKT